MKEIPDIRPDYDQPNYDPDKIAPYTLEDPLEFLDGSRVKSSEDWQRRRREILDIFAREMYGAEPPLPESVVCDKIDEQDGALAGFAVRTQYRMFFKSDRSGPFIDWLLLRPRYAEKPSPVILFLNYKGNHQLIPDEEVVIPEMWSREMPGHRVPPERGVLSNPNGNTVVPMGMLLSAGFAVLSACYCQVSPDPTSKEPEACFNQSHFPYNGVFELWGERDEKRTDNITSLGAWAWALCRGADLVNTIPELDSGNICVTGCSRLGKAALIAAARDERFSAVVPVQCGGGGATLAKRDYGENVGTQMRMFTHWYCKAYGKYARNPAALLNFDQHLLLAAVAPRRLLIAGFNKPWFDTEGEYLACRAASAAWEANGLPGMPEGEFPADFDTSLIGSHFGYYRRPEEHGIAAFDWWQIIEFFKNSGKEQQ